MPTEFERRLEEGMLGEGMISLWLQSYRYMVLPAYEIEVSQGKGPRVFTCIGDLVAPDLLCFNGKKTFWCEAKTKSAFTWHRQSETFQTGIDRRHWLEYLKVSRLSHWEVWLLFLHKAGNLAKDTPTGMVSPSGLFGNPISLLATCIHHEHDGWGKSGMVYWEVSALRKIAEYETVVQRTIPILAKSFKANSFPVRITRNHSE